MRGLQGQAWVDVSGCEAAAFDRGISNGQRLFTGSSAANEKSYENQAWQESVWTGLLVDQGMLQGKADSCSVVPTPISRIAGFGAIAARQLRHSPCIPGCSGWSIFCLSAGGGPRR